MKNFLALFLVFSILFSPGFAFVPATFADEDDSQSEDVLDDDSHDDDSDDNDDDLEEEEVTDALLDVEAIDETDVEQVKAELEDLKEVLGTIERGVELTEEQKAALVKFTALQRSLRRHRRDGDVRNLTRDLMKTVRYNKEIRSELVEARQKFRVFGQSVRNIVKECRNEDDRQSCLQERKAEVKSEIRVRLDEHKMEMRLKKKERAPAPPAPEDDSSDDSSQQ